MLKDSIWYEKYSRLQNYAVAIKWKKANGEDTTLLTAAAKSLASELNLEVYNEQSSS